MKYFVLALKRYADFSGRSTRPEYWYFFLFNLIFAIAAMLLDSMLGLNFNYVPYGYIYVLYGIAMLLPGLSAAVRRLHDIDKSGWWILISLIPFVGAIWLLVLLASTGTEGPNRYGDNPAHPAFDFEVQKAS